MMIAEDYNITRKLYSYYYSSLQRIENRPSVVDDMIMKKTNEELQFF